jgi:hypothetical protein
MACGRKIAWHCPPLLGLVGIVAVQNYLLLIRDARIAIYNKWVVGAKEKAIATHEVLADNTVSALILKATRQINL